MVDKACPLHEDRIKLYCIDQTCTSGDQRPACSQCFTISPHKNHMFAKLQQYIGKVESTARFLQKDQKRHKQPSIVLKELLTSHIENIKDKFYQQLNAAENHLLEQIEGVKRQEPEIVDEIYSYINDIVDGKLVQNCSKQTADFGLKLYNDEKVIDCFSEMDELLQKMERKINRPLENLDKQVYQLIQNFVKPLKNIYLEDNDNDFDMESFNGKPKKIEAHNNWINCVVSIGKNKIATGSLDNSIKFWDTTKISEEFSTVNDYIEKFEASKSVACLLKINQTQLASGGYDEDIRIWDMRTCQEQNRLAGHKSAVVFLTKYSENEILSCSWDHSIILWNLQKKPHMVMQLKDHTDFVTGVQKIGEHDLVSGSFDGTLRLWDISKDPPQSKIIEQTIFYIKCVLYLGESEFARGGTDKKIVIWNKKTDTPKLVKELTGHTGGVICLAKVNATILASGSWDKKIILWDWTKDTPQMKVLQDNFGDINAIIIISGSRIISVGNEKQIRVWE